jgi:WD40 repeat protein
MNPNITRLMRANTTIDEDTETPLTGQYLAISHAQSPYLTIYSRAGDSYVKVTDPVILPAALNISDPNGGGGGGVSFGFNGTYLAVAHTVAPFLTIYKRTGNTFTKLPNPAILPTGKARAVHFSADGTYLAVAINPGSPGLIIYKRTGDVFTKLADPDITHNNAYACSFSINTNYLALGLTSAPNIVIYKRIGDSFIKLAKPTTSNDCYGCRFSPDGAYLARAHASTPFIFIDKRNGDTFTPLPNPITIPINRGMSVAWSPDSIYLVIGLKFTHPSPGIFIYKRNGDIFTKLSNPAVLPPNGANINGVVFNSTGVYLSLAMETTPFVMTYKRNGDTFTALSNPPSLPTGFGFAVDYYQ